jgi:hypothetical protein
LKIIIPKGSGCLWGSTRRLAAFARFLGNGGFFKGAARHLSSRMEMDPNTVASLISNGLLILLIVSFVLILRDKRRARKQREADRLPRVDGDMEMEQDTKSPLS